MPINKINITEKTGNGWSAKKKVNKTHSNLKKESKEIKLLKGVSENKNTKNCETPNLNGTENDKTFKTRTVYDIKQSTNPIFSNWGGRKNCRNLNSRSPVPEDSDKTTRTRKGSAGNSKEEPKLSKSRYANKNLKSYYAVGSLFYDEIKRHTSKNMKSQIDSKSPPSSTTEYTKINNLKKPHNITTKEETKIQQLFNIVNKSNNSKNNETRLKKKLQNKNNVDNAKLRNVVFDAKPNETGRSPGIFIMRNNNRRKVNAQVSKPRKDDISRSPNIAVSSRDKTKGIKMGSEQSSQIISNSRSNSTISDEILSEASSESKASSRTSTTGDETRSELSNSRSNSTTADGTLSKASSEIKTRSSRTSTTEDDVLSERSIVTNVSSHNSTNVTNVSSHTSTNVTNASSHTSTNVTNASSDTSTNVTNASSDTRTDEIPTETSSKIEVKESVWREKDETITFPSIEVTAGVNEENLLSALLSVHKSNDWFSIKLFKKLGNHQGNNNLIISPQSMKSILSLTYCGAERNTLKEILRVFKLPTDENIMKSAYLNFIINLKRSKSLNTSSSIAIDTEYIIYDGFKATSMKFFGSEVIRYDFKKNRTGGIDYINYVVKEKTYGEVEKVVNENDLPSKVNIILIDVLHFHPVWDIKFDPQLTTHGKFYVNEHESVAIEMMHVSNKFSYLHDKELRARILELTVDKNKYSMFILLPDKIGDIDKLHNNLCEHDLSNDLLNNLNKIDLDVALPKFSLSQTLDLTEVLKLFGIKDLFNRKKSNLSKITSSNCFVNKVILQTSIEVDHNLGSKMPNLPPESTPFSRKKFVADRPFIFIVTKNKTLNNFSILTIGKFGYIISDTKSASNMAVDVKPRCYKLRRCS